MPLTILEPDILTRNWWVVLLRGLAGIAFGVFAIVAPRITLASLILLFGIYAIVDGALLLVSAVRHRGNERPRASLVLEGLLSLAAGVFALFWPGLTAFALLLLIAARAIVTGVLEIIVAIRLRKTIEGEWLLILSGVVSMGFGVLLARYPVSGAIAVVAVIGTFAMVYGVLLSVLAFRLRSWGKPTLPPYGGEPHHRPA